MEKQDLLNKVEELCKEYFGKNVKFRENLINLHIVGIDDDTSSFVLHVEGVYDNNEAKYESKRS